MSSATTVLESALRTSLLDLLRDKARGLAQSVDVESAIANVLGTVHRVIAEFGGESNRARPPGSWHRLPAELRLETARWMPPASRTKMLRASRDIREHLLQNTSLWTTIAVPEGDYPMEQRLFFMRSMLARSGTRPLDLEWTDAPYHTSDGIDAASVTILQVAPRAKTLALHPGYVSDDKDTIWASAMPFLEELSVNHTQEDIELCLTISAEAWSGARAPLLRDVRLPDTRFAGMPQEPFRSVLYLEADVYDASWDPIWAWFPQLESLVLTVVAREPPPLPPPPDSLRRVVLRPSVCCWDPGRLLRGWKTHRVRQLELFSHAADALARAAWFLRAGDPTPWAVSVTQECGPEDEWDDWFARSALRGEHATATVWCDSMNRAAQQLRMAQKKNALVARPRELTLSNLKEFHGKFSFPNLRTLTIADSAGDIPRVLLSTNTRLTVPKLARLVVDLTAAPRPLEVLARVRQFIARVLIRKPGSRFRELVVRLSEPVDRQAAEIASFPTEVAKIARDVRMEYLPSAPSHDDSCSRDVSHE